MYTAVWASLSALLAALVVGHVEADDLVVTIAGYLILGIALGIGIERWRREHAELQRLLRSMDAFQAQLTANQKRYRLLFESSNDAVYLHGLDHHGEPTRFAAVNDAACERLGYTREEMLGLLPRKVDAAPRPGQLREVMARLLLEDKVMWESVLRTRSGEKIPVEIASSLTDVDGELVVISIARDISGRKEQEERLLELSLRDHLTGLLNRRGFLVMLPEHRKLAKRSGTQVIVLYADLDGLKGINDREGHGRGDEAIRAVAVALRQTFRESDLVARLGGDEFCVVAQADAAGRPQVVRRPPGHGPRRGRRQARPPARHELRHRGDDLAWPRGRPRAPGARRCPHVRGEARSPHRGRGSAGRGRCRRAGRSDVGGGACG